uniref:Type-4 uracil-DNA glycosylase n=1 Tax=uncultured delta proteobacterium TaxID=34034 RepID=H5SJE7_9DELT|nr:DNA polymerase bacteriophage-type [uncultured delta proteobacterium]
MADRLRDELADIVRRLAVYLEWQRELGTTVLVAGTDVRRTDRTQLSTRATEELKEPFQHERHSEPATDAPGSMSFANPMPPREDTATATPWVPSGLRLQRLHESEEAEKTPERTPGLSRNVPVGTTPALFGDADTSRSAVHDTLAGPRLEGSALLEALAAIENEVRHCTRCRLHEQRTQTVFSRGNPSARLAFVGEGPGREEDLQGKPFVGAAGQLLDRIIAAMGMTEGDVYIANVVKCRPPSNRVPMPDEMDACGGYLTRQLELVRPEVIVALGKTAASFLLETNAPMSKLRGQWHQWKGIPVRVTWHPAYLLRQPAAKRDTWEDMKQVMDKLGLPIPRTGGRG